MAKDKKASKAAVPASKPDVAKPIENVKGSRVVKPAEKPRTVSKETAKSAVKASEKSSKKAKKEPSPEPSSDEDMTSDSSASSDGEGDSGSDSDDEGVPKNVNGSKSNGTTGAKADAGSDDGSSDDSDSDGEAAVEKQNAPLVDDPSATSDSDSESDNGDKEDAEDGTSDSGSSESSEGEEDGPQASADRGSKAHVAAPETAEQETVGKKRKAGETFQQTPKKTKVTVNGEEKEAVANLFVGNLSWSVDEEWLTREFEDYGELKGVRIITDRDSGRSKGFGYVEFVDVANAIKAVEEKQGAQIDGRDIRLDFSTPRDSNPRSNDQTPQQRSFDRAQKYGDKPKEPSSTLFVGNVSFDADESMLSELFQDFGSIKAVRLPTDRDSGALKGYGYVDMSSIDEAKAAFDALQGAELGGRTIRLDYAGERPSNDSPRGGFGGRGGRGDRGGSRGGGFRGGRGGFNDRGRGGRGGSRGGSRGTTNRGGFGDFSGRKTTF